MLIFTMLPDVEKFLSLADRSRGEVLLHLPDGGRCSLKEDHTARQLLRLLAPGGEALEISLSNPADTAAFVRYMGEAALESASSSTASS